MSLLLLFLHTFISVSIFSLLCTFSEDRANVSTISYWPLYFEHKKHSWCGTLWKKSVWKVGYTTAPWATFSYLSWPEWSMVCEPIINSTLSFFQGCSDKNACLHSLPLHHSLIPFLLSFLPCSLIPPPPSLSSSPSLSFLPQDPGPSNVIKTLSLWVPTMSYCTLCFGVII